MTISGSIENVIQEGVAQIGTPFEIVLPVPNLDAENSIGEGLSVLLTAEWLAAQVGAQDTGFIIGRSDHYWATNNTPSVFHVGDGLLGLSIAGGHTLAGGVSAGPQVSGQSGASASVTGFAVGVATIEGLTGMTANSVGNTLRISGAASAGNNGDFPIVAFNSASSVDVSNPDAVAGDANNASITWSEHFNNDIKLTVTHSGVGADLKLFVKLNLRVQEI